MINMYRARIKESNPLIHCITNPISIKQCANAILAVGARPIMAEHPMEAGVVTKSAGAVMLNLGNITDVRMESMRISAQTAFENKIPFCIDICGAACLKNRRDYALSLIKAYTPTVIKGNYSEIYALKDPDYSSSGVDSDAKLTDKQLEETAADLAKSFGTTILASGKTDIVTNGQKLARIFNGSPQMTTITGTGCMQGALCAAFLSTADGFDAAVSASILLGISGELAETNEGSGTFEVKLMDRLSTMTDKMIDDHIDIYIDTGF